MNAALPPMHAELGDLIDFMQAPPGGMRIRNTERTPKGLARFSEQPTGAQGV